ncbi:MAG TPA: DUF1573 domain-containing protein [Thermoguttaceae bacterium]
MNRKTGLLLVWMVLAASPLAAQEWAAKMFQEKQYDFGVCARNASAEYKFVFENIYMEDVHVAGVRTSCGCTTPRVENDALKTYEKGAIVAHFNTDRFLGQRGATITVTFDKPYYAQVQLHVRGHIRGDVVVEPGSVRMGAVDVGTPVDQKVKVYYSGGQGNWQILDVKSANPHLKAEVLENIRNSRQVAYELKVHLDENAPVGYINDYLMLVTNDNRGTQIPLLVEGCVEAEITVSPAALFMGVLQPGQKVTRQLIVKSKTPFKIVDIICDDNSFKFDTSSEQTPKTLHVIPVTFVAPSDTMGRVVKSIKIETEQGQLAPELSAYAVVTNQ